MKTVIFVNLLGLWQVVIQIEALEKPLPHIVRDFLLRDGHLHEVNGAFGGVQHDAAIVTTREVLFDLLAQFGRQFSVNVFGESAKHGFAISVGMVAHFSSFRARRSP
jgi:hypothetical protein